MASRSPVHQARKRFGQNFLRDPGIISRIVRAIGPRPSERLVEIGPGQGALTEPLLEATGRLEVIELDRDLIPGLRVQFFNYPEFVIHEGDALKFDFQALRGEGERLRVVGNLPYNISTPLIAHLLQAGDAIADMHFMLQKEVVDRLAAEPGGPDWGRLSVMAQYRCRVDSLFVVPPEAFVPRPKVDSAIVRLTPHGELPETAVDEALLFALVREAFGQRRKTLRNNLKGRIDSAALEALGIDPARRPQTLSVAEFVRIANHLASGDPQPGVAT
ncbi:16S rRNA (adenine(1518)-N(6)/adenine(1519)-N(6))-dimethyltransferase RsmA [Halomonas urumqiensis]|uniref:Ribosomal RNA small subunit methyltransferase A n=1 Tax=Halomonas urumqiensis TaxID=1684789 RepID=A0A2N7UC52_9GAMM|nr:16S rRNA (adenine(1518)-N(6)/adenine(1519)-N(6))-dimethyltransferase RsmA [Halomonas urumqiensis]PMR78014.1 16S rRNA (adenine(1518)-N(6)/adenine(1519)-N(6))-dimethyltransferase [Halomonas urumqiensis]PTB03165.1 16S rRNA (adenine(1518)-N(6)/adenine(1519)-N(6))-dimethyltransferase RsmA [Halomonas urumqiensis]GHE20691.1 ribosomal RNA small subunit methyltransferase A [Halomonas urumqiensis]